MTPQVQTPQVQPRLIGLGIVLALVGVLALGLMAFDRTKTEDARVSAPVGAGIPADQVTPNPLTRLWPVVGGLSLALGAALIGIGMNRWRKPAWHATEKPHRSA